MWRVGLLLLVGCDRLFDLKHLPDRPIDAPPADASTVCFADGFESPSIDTDHWTHFEGPTTAVMQKNGQLAITIGTAVDYAGIVSNVVDLTNSAIQVDLVQAPDEGGSDEAGISMQIDSDNEYSMFTADGFVFYHQRVAGINDEEQTQYDPLRHVQFRVRDEATRDSNVVHFETSDGATWTDRKAVMAIVPTTALRFEVYGGAFNAGGSATMAVFDNFVLSGYCPPGV